MKKFISRTIKFSLIWIVTLSILISFTNYLVIKKASFKVSGDVDKIVLGHSHPECAFDDSLIPNFANFSNSGESYLYTYFKTIKLLEQNKQIKTVFVEFTNNQIDPSANEWAWGEKFMSYRYPVYGPFMDIEANWLLLSKNPDIFFKDLGLLVEKNLFFLMGGKYDYTKKMGGYLHLERDKTESILASMSEIEKTDDNNYEISGYSLYYLQKIINECNEKNVKVYLIRSPMHPRSLELNNEKYFQAILNSKFSNIEFLDFKDFPLANSEFGDLEHLNFHGAEKFSLFFNELLKNGLLEKSNNQEFINTEMKKISKNIQ